MAAAKKTAKKTAAKKTAPAPVVAEPEPQDDERSVVRGKIKPAAKSVIRN